VHQLQSCASLCITVHHCTSLCIAVHHCTSLYIAAHHCMSLYASLWARWALSLESHLSLCSRCRSRLGTSVTRGPPSSSYVRSRDGVSSVRFGVLIPLRVSPPLSYVELYHCIKMCEFLRNRLMEVILSDPLSRAERLSSDRGQIRSDRNPIIFCLVCRPTIVEVRLESLLPTALAVWIMLGTLSFDM
jgi:hypothetical protein